MQAYYEIETEIPVDHQLNIKIPADIPTGRAKIAVIYDMPTSNTIKPTEPLADLMDSLPDLPLFKGEPLEIQEAIRRRELKAFFHPYQQDMHNFKFDREEANAR